MVVNQSVDMFWRMHQQLASCCEKAAEKSEWPRFKTPQVCRVYFREIFFFFFFTGVIADVADCPEREATYVITKGGIGDPDKI